MILKILITVNEPDLINGDYTISTNSIFKSSRARYKRIDDVFSYIRDEVALHQEHSRKSPFYEPEED